ncbi:MAG: capsular polysaccharide synthesis protein [Candidatus Cryptobacteroides sp.]
MSRSRFLTKAEIVLKGHILNLPWRPHLERRRVRGRVTAKAVGSYLDFLVPAIKANSGIRQPQQEDRKEEEKIFSVWLQGEGNAPKIVRSCWGSIKANCPQELVILDADSLPQWVDLPDHIIGKWKSGKMGPAHFTDICRLALLHKYGGLWLDSTDFVSAPIPQWILDEDFFVYMSGDTLKGSYSFIQNCFIRARKGNYLTKAWLDAVLEYWEAEDSVIDYFVHQLIFRKVIENDPAAASLFGKMPKVSQDAAHELWFGNGRNPFDEDGFRRMTGAAAFQKTEYKSSTALNPPEGSFAEKVMNMY